MDIYPQERSGVQALCWFVGLLLIGAVVAGIYLGGSELLSPSVHSAEVDKLEAEAAALREQTTYEERQHQMELDVEEQKAEVELGALQARRAKQLELMEPLAIIGMVVGSIATLTLTFAVSYYFIKKARAGEVQSAERGQPLHQQVVASPSKRDPLRAPEGEQPPSPIERARVHLDDITYDGFLAYFHDYILQPNRTPVFYHAGIEPGIRDVYLAVLAEARIITWGTNGHSGWILPQRIREVEDVRRRISRRAFCTLVTSRQEREPVEPLPLRGVNLEGEPTPVYWSS
jgi:hypothetical protein